MAEKKKEIKTLTVRAMDIKTEFGNPRKISKKKRDELKGRIFISKAVILLCEAKHNRDADLLSNYVYDKKYGLTDEEIDQKLQEVRDSGEYLEVPEYVYDVHTRKGKKMGKTKEEFFKDENDALANKQMSIFDLFL